MNKPKNRFSQRKSGFIHVIVLIIVVLFLLFYFRAPIERFLASPNIDESNREVSNILVKIWDNFLRPIFKVAFDLLIQIWDKIIKPIILSVWNQTGGRMSNIPTNPSLR